ncbi:putative holin [Sodalis sp. RH23]|uniref:putative holin n=1 Tax=unclassified Sodalis (in: enterobacteria) TaxID=2636512 RepID=UPI0039B5234B
MSEPVSATAVVTTGAGVATLGWFSGLDPAVVIGSFAGAVFFVTSAADLTVPKRLGFFIVSLVFGVLACRPASEIITTVLLLHTRLPDSIGALVAGAMAIKILMASSIGGGTAKLLGSLGAFLSSSGKGGKDG